MLRSALGVLRRPLRTRALSTLPPDLPLGTLLVWGKPDDGRLGMKVEQSFGAKDVLLGPIVPPTVNPHIHDVVEVVCSAMKTMALTKDGSVYSWGGCQNLSLGHGDDVRNVLRPKKLEALSGIRIVHISGGETASAAVSADGDIYTWGWGGGWGQGSGGLGHGDRTTQPRPALIQSLEAAGTKMVQVAVGNGHMLGLTATGQVMSWGKGEYGRCGNGRGEQATPEVVDLLRDTMCVQVAAGPQHSLALTADGRVYAWGKNDASQLGQGGNMVMDLNTMEDYPLVVEADDEDEAPHFAGKVVAIAAGSNHSLALTSEGRVYQWGQRLFLTPSPVGRCYRAARGAGASAGEELRGAGLSAGDSSVSAVVDAQGRVYSWGRNTGALGHYGSGTRLATCIEALSGLSISRVSFGAKHAAAVVGPPPRRGAAAGAPPIAGAAR